MFKIETIEMEYHSLFPMFYSKNNLAARVEKTKIKIVCEMWKTFSI